MKLLLSVATKPVQEDETPQTFDEKELKGDVLEVLQTEIERQRNREELETALHAIESKPNHPQEPAAPMLETLLRYRAANIHELEHLLGIFERARRIRLGES
jgi:Zn-dependent M16 (insulinase) family peptidase